MKQLYILLLVLPLLCHSYPLDEANSSEDSEIAESETQISKRSGGLDLVTHLKSGILASLGRASASIASGSSGSSSSYKSYDSGQSNSVEYDPWSLKKSVLNTLFQAVKAITGGVTALKGQLIKGSGYVLSAGGKLVAASGDKVTDVGKSIINSAQLSPIPQSHGSSHPFGKISSLSGGSSGGGHHSPGPVVHTETITTYEIPAGHHNYGPPSKPPSFSSATHQYLPPQSYSAGAPFASHAAFEAPSPNYLPSKYGPSYDGHDAFNIYGRHTKLSEKEVRKAANELQEILHLIPGKSKPDMSNTINAEKDQDGYIYPDKSDYSQYDLPPLRQLESISHVESVTAAYGPPIPYKSPSSHSNLETKNPSDVYRQMAHRLKNTGKSEPSNIPPGYMYPNPQKATSLNSYPPSPAVLQNIVKSTSFQVNLDSYRPSDLDGSPLGPQQSIAQPYTYFNPAQNRIDAPHYDRRRDVRHPNIKNFEYIKDYRIRDPAIFNRKLMT